jgi:hypothetical protein
LGPGFGCGAVLGLGLGLLGTVATDKPAWLAGLGGSLLLALVFGLLTRRYGERFLTKFLDWLG